MLLSYRQGTEEFFGYLLYEDIIIIEEDWTGLPHKPRVIEISVAWALIPNKA